VNQGKNDSFLNAYIHLKRRTSTKIFRRSNRFCAFFYRGLICTEGTKTTSSRKRGARCGV